MSGTGGLIKVEDHMDVGATWAAHWLTFPPWGRRPMVVENLRRPLARALVLIGDGDG